MQALVLYMLHKNEVCSIETKGIVSIRIRQRDTVQYLGSLNIFHSPLAE